MEIDEGRIDREAAADEIDVATSIMKPLLMN